jgi:hypothetical protein
VIAFAEASSAVCARSNYERFTGTCRPTVGMAILRRWVGLATVSPMPSPISNSDSEWCYDPCDRFPASVRHARHLGTSLRAVPLALAATGSSTSESSSLLPVQITVTASDSDSELLTQTACQCSIYISRPMVAVRFTSSSGAVRLVCSNSLRHWHDDH